VPADAAGLPAELRVARLLAFKPQQQQQQSGVMGCRVKCGSSSGGAGSSAAAAEVGAQEAASIGAAAR
jgi:hypothetical protein